MSLEKISKNLSNRTNRDKLYLSSNRLIDTNSSNSDRAKTNKIIESIVRDNSDLIAPGWEARHAKYCYKHGVAKYVELTNKARKYGANPQALLATLINKEM